ncbi:MAG TPA: contractile injection system protein, VgrG/Pvc8 family [Acidimicrobiales bacterium]|nr:contractile injection system protein, VgrG/Pvc8 family [Acidimicrobiales bacterium]
MPDTLLRTSAPVLEVAGVIRSDLRRDLLSLVVAHTTDGLATLRATFTAAGTAGDTPGQLRLLDVDPIELGTALTVSIGDGPGRLVFEGAVSAVEARFSEGHAPRVVLYAEDGLFPLCLTAHRRTWEDVDDEDIVRTVAGAHGLLAEVQVGGPTARHVQQWNESDLGFLRRRAHLLAADLWIEGRTVHLATRENRPGEEVVLRCGANLVAVDLRADLAHQRTEAVVTGYDAERREPIEEQSTVSDLAGEPGTGRLGPKSLEMARGEVAVVLHDLVPTHRAEAEAWATAELRRRARSFLTATAITNGTPELAVGSRVTLMDAGTPFEGDGWYATRVRQTFDLAEGHRTEARLERARIGV